MMVMVDPKLYRPKVIVTTEKLLYVRMKTAIYRLLRSALLFHLRLVRDLKEFGSELVICTANKTINVTMTVT